MKLSTRTKNHSFLNLQYLLQDNNVENAFFMNYTLDDDLCDIDIYDYVISAKNSDEREIRLNKIKEECANNIWFFFREIARLSDPYHDITDTIKYGNELALYPITLPMAKLIYFSTFTNSKCMYKFSEDNMPISNSSYKHFMYRSYDDYVNITMALLGIYYEFFGNGPLSLEKPITRAKIEFATNKNTMQKPGQEVFWELFQKEVYAMNYIISSPCGIYKSYWESKANIKYNVRDNNSDINYWIYPKINDNDTLMTILDKMASNEINRATVVFNPSDSTIERILFNWVFHIYDTYRIFDQLKNEDNLPHNPILIN